MTELGWLGEYSEPALRSALRVAGVGLEELPVDLTGTNDLGRPVWAMGSATIDRRFLARRRLSLERIMALHVRTTLGDALWRSEAGLPLLLPRAGGGTPADYVDELAERLALLGIEP